MTVKLFHPIINSPWSKSVVQIERSRGTPTFKLPPTARTLNEQQHTHDHPEVSAAAHESTAKPPLSSLYAERARAAKDYMAARDNTEKKNKSTGKEGHKEAALLHEEESATPTPGAAHLASAQDEELETQCEASQGIDQEAELELVREMGERLEALAGSHADKGDMLIRLTHPLFENTQLRVRIVKEKVLVDCECATANEAEWFRSHADDLSSRIGDRLQRTMKMQVNNETQENNG